MQLSPQIKQKLESPLWRFEHWYKIKDKNGNLIPFRLNETQKAYIKARKSSKRNIILKPRQKGFSTFKCVESFDKCIMQPGTTAAIIAHEREAVSKLFEIVKRLYDNMPDFFKPKTHYNNRNELVFVENFLGQKLDSKIYISLKLRSGTTNYLHISESAYIEGKQRQELNAGSKQTVPIDGFISEETTANGFNEFYDEVQDALAQWDIDNGVPQHLKTKVHFFSWIKDSEYTLEVDPISILPLSKEEKRLKKLGASFGHLAWRRWKLRDFSASKDPQTLKPEQQFKQEYPATLSEAFQSSGSTFFDIDQVIKIKIKSPKSCKIPGLKVYYEPDDKLSYFVGVDPSNGKNIDYAAIAVWDSDLKQVAQWHGYTDPDLLADITKDVAIMYNNAKINVENNLITTILRLQKIYNKANLYRYTKEDRVNKVKKVEYGYNTNGKTKRQLTDEFRRLFRDGALEINSEITKSEMQTFLVPEKGTPEHAPGKHDDALIADMLAVHFSQKPNWMQLFK